MILSFFLIFSKTIFVNFIFYFSGESCTWPKKKKKKPNVHFIGTWLLYNVKILRSNKKNFSILTVVGCDKLPWQNTHTHTHMGEKMFILSCNVYFILQFQLQSILTGKSRMQGPESVTHTQRWQQREANACMYTSLCSALSLNLLSPVTVLPTRWGQPYLDSPA